MKRNLVLLLTFLITATAFTQDWKKEPFMTQSLTGKNIRNVVVKTSGGNITVQHGENERVEVYVTPNNYRSAGSVSRQELEQRLKEYYELELTTDNNTLRAIARPLKNMRNWNSAVSVSFTVYVSADVSTKLNTSGGNVGLYGLNGNQDFTTSGGNLNLERLKGTIEGRTSGGNINLKDVSDKINLTTSGGNIKAENCRGTMELTTSGGSVTLEALDGTIEATTSGGNIRGGSIRGDLTAHTSGGNVDLEDLRCAINAGTSGGNVDVEIVELTGAVKLSNSSGSIDLSVPGNKGMDLNLRASRIKTDALSNFSGSVEEDEVVGKVNGGGTAITVKAGSGRINLSLR